MKTFSTTLLAIAIVAGTFSACKKDNRSASKTSTQAAFGLKADNAAVPLTLNSTGSQTLNTVAGTNNITWTSAVANVTAFKLEAKTHNTEIEITSKNLVNIDLFSPAPPFISALIDTGTYTEIEIKALFTKTSGSNIPLTLKGTFSNNSTATPIEFDFNDDAYIKAEVKNVTFSSAHPLAATITLHLNKLLAGITNAQLNSATLTGGVLIISSSSNTDIYNKIVSNLSTSGESEGFDDHGGNGDHNSNDHGSDG